MYGETLIQHGGGEAQLIINTQNITFILGITKETLEQIRDITLESSEINIDFTTFEMKIDNYKMDIIKQFKLNKEIGPYILFKIKLSEPTNYKINMTLFVNEHIWSDYLYKAPLYREPLETLYNRTNYFFKNNQFKFNINESITKLSLDEYNDDSIFYFNEEQLLKLEIDIKRVKELLTDTKSFAIVYDNTAVKNESLNNNLINRIFIKKDRSNSIIGIITYNKHNNIIYMNTLPFWYYNELRVADFIKDTKFVNNYKDPLFYNSNLL